jgi:hypothetical protein
VPPSLLLRQAGKAASAKTGQLRPTQPIILPIMPPPLPLRLHGFHHVGHLAVHLEQLVDLGTSTPEPAAMRFLREA